MFVLYLILSEIPIENSINNSKVNDAQPNYVDNGVFTGNKATKWIDLYT